MFEKVSSWLTPMKLKWFLKKNPESISTLQPWSYIFSWDYSFEDFFAFLDAWPQVSYVPVTFLEWRSIYDIDAALTRKEYTYAWEYIDFVTNDLIINKYINRYEFLENAAEIWWLQTLEWFLYPETYFVDQSKDFIDQVVFLQLEAFQKNVWEPYQDQILGFNDYLGIQWYEAELTWHDMLTLASVIEKEERVDDNKDDIAWVFLNRLDSDMRIDADITLCYGLEEPYESCTPTIIVENLRDDTNTYNTRAVSGLPPTPIANIHVNSLIGLLDVKQSQNFFYLHDDSGRIHLSKDLPEHNRKKSKYLN